MAVYGTLCRGSQPELFAVPSHNADTAGLTSSFSLDDFTVGEAEANAESFLTGDAASPDFPHPLTRT